jgi:hypothetical protein
MQNKQELTHVDTALDLLMRSSLLEKSGIAREIASIIKGAIGIFLISNVCFAQTENAPTIGELSRIQAQTWILKAKLEQLNARAALEARAHVAHKDLKDELPKVQAVYGVNHKLVAVLRYRTGKIIDVKLGDKLEGGFKVSAISVDKVELTRNARVFQVGLSAKAFSMPIEIGQSMQLR